MVLTTGEFSHFFGSSSTASYIVVSLSPPTGYHLGLADTTGSGYHKKQSLPGFAGCCRLPQATAGYHQLPSATTDYHRIPLTTTSNGYHLSDTTHYHVAGLLPPSNYHILSATTAGSRICKKTLSLPEFAGHYQLWEMFVRYYSPFV